MPPVLHAASCDALCSGGSGAGGIVGSAIQRYTGGPVTLARGAAFAAVPGITPLTVDASAGDLIGFSVNMLALVPTDTALFDAATIVSGSPVNYFSGETGTASNLGLPGWYSPSALDQGAGEIDGTAYYIVQAGDIAAGQVTVGLRFRAAGATADPTIAADANGPLITALVNWGQP